MTQPAAAITTHNADGEQVRRYPIPHPVTGEVVELPNISSVVAVLQAFGLEGWKLRHAAVGIVHRLDLQAAIATAHLIPADDRGRFTDRNKGLNDAIESAIEHGQCLAPDIGYLKNDFGTAIHLLDELIDQGAVTDIMNLPASVAEHAESYVRLMADFGIEVIESEFTVYGSAGWAGTGDRIVRFSMSSSLHGMAIAPAFERFDLGRGCFVVDVKTGKVKKSAALQLAALANGDTIYDAAEGEHRPLPADLRTDVAFILHQPGGAQLVPVDIGPAWPAFLGALAVKQWDETKPLHPVLVPPVSDGAGPQTSAPSDPPKVVDLMGALADSLDAAKAAAAAKRAEENAEAAALLEDCDPPPAVPTARAVVCGPGGCQTIELPTEPVHIAETLKGAIAAIPYDAPETDKAIARTAYLTERLQTLISHQPDATVVWPDGVPTFRHHREAGTHHELAELELIEQAISAAEQATGSPFPLEPDPTDLRNRVPADDPRVVDILQRFDALPSDLRNTAATQAAEAGVRRFSAGAGTEQCVQSWHSILEAAELAHTDRTNKVANALGVLADSGITTAALIVAVGSHENPTAWQYERLDDLADCATAGHLTLDPDTGQLVVDAEAVLKEWGGSKRPLLAAAKTIAGQWGIEKPAKADDALANPLLAAALFLTEQDPHEATDPAAPAA